MGKIETQCVGNNMKSVYQKEISELVAQKNQSSLISRNITVMGRRTSIRLEPEMWDALHDIAKREKCSVHDLCTLVYLCKNIATSLTAAIRVFLMLYFQAASNEQGHIDAGHGSFDTMKKRARISSDYEGFFKNKRKYSFGEEKRLASVQ